MQCIQQGDDEPLWEYVQWFIRAHNTIPQIPDYSLIEAFKGGLASTAWVVDLAKALPLSVKALLNWAWKDVDAEEDVKLILNKHSGSSRSGSHHNDHLVNKKKSSRSDGSKRTSVLAAFNGKPNPSPYKGKGKPAAPTVAFHPLPGDKGDFNMWCPNIKPTGTTSRTAILSSRKFKMKWRQPSKEATR